jgi:ferritin
MSLGWEQEVTGQIHAMVDLAIQEKDYASQAFLQWFVTEQVEEEKQAGEMVQTLSAVGEDPATLLILDRELGARRPEADEA